MKFSPLLNRDGYWKRIVSDDIIIDENDANNRYGRPYSVGCPKNKRPNRPSTSKKREKASRSNTRTLEQKDASLEIIKEKMFRVLNMRMYGFTSKSLHPSTDDFGLANGSKREEREAQRAKSAQKYRSQNDRGVYRYFSGGKYSGEGELLLTPNHIGCPRNLDELFRRRQVVMSQTTQRSETIEPFSHPKKSIKVAIGSNQKRSFGLRLESRRIELHTTAINIIDSDRAGEENNQKMPIQKNRRITLKAGGIGRMEGFNKQMFVRKKEVESSPPIPDFIQFQKTDSSQTLKRKQFQEQYIYESDIGVDASEDEIDKERDEYLERGGSSMDYGAASGLIEDLDDEAAILPLICRDSCFRSQPEVLWNRTMTIPNPSMFIEPGQKVLHQSNQTDLHITNQFGEVKEDNLIEAASSVKTEVILNDEIIFKNQKDRKVSLSECDESPPIIEPQVWLKESAASINHSEKTQEPSKPADVQLKGKESLDTPFSGKYNLQNLVKKTKFIAAMIGKPVAPGGASLDYIEARKNDQRRSKLLKGLPMPKLPKPKSLVRDFGVIVGFSVNTSAGRCNSFNEDRVTILTNAHTKYDWLVSKSISHCSYFGIYDGHRGSFCSDYLRDKLHGQILADLDQKDLSSSITHSLDSLDRDLLEKTSKESLRDGSGSCVLGLLVLGRVC